MQAPFLYLLATFIAFMYAIVDIETTGGHAAGNDITEIAIVVHDGEKIVQRFESLVKPDRTIPYYIQTLTGISMEMVADAPRFEELAGTVHELLKDRVFIAHNVNFDYSFVKHHLSTAGYDLDAQKLCTVRLSRKVFPGLPSYSLGNLCRHFGISNEQRHRAGGDADATVKLFEHLLQNNAAPHIPQFTRKKSAEQSLPPHLSKDIVDRLPYTPGVYYFHDNKGKVVYVGKAKNLKFRVRSHFTHNGAGRQRQDFLRNIHDISFEETGTELMAFILESVEIRRLWPEFNRSQKKFTPSFGLYRYEDRNGYIRLAIDKQKKHLQPLYTFNLLVEGHRLMRKMMEAWHLCPKLCFVQTDHSACVGVEGQPCNGACEQKEPVDVYNARVEEAVAYLEQLLPSFAVVGEGKRSGEQSCILMEKGRFYGMGYLPGDTAVSDIESLKDYLTRYSENDYIRGLVYQHVDRYPKHKVVFPG
jgi:DNA polymerase-3 subunit epsilon